MDVEAALSGDFGLAFLYRVVVEFLDVAALQAHEVIVVPALIQFINCFAAFKMMAYQQSGALELRQNPVHRGQSGISAVFEHELVDVLGGKMPYAAAFEQFENAQAWQRGFETYGLEIGRGTHLRCGRRIEGSSIQAALSY